MSQVYREPQEPTVRQLNGHGNRRFEITFPEDSGWLRRLDGKVRRARLHEQLDEYLNRYEKETAA